MFFDQFNSKIGEDLYYSIYDITIAENHRPHTHQHAEQGLDDYTHNWELVETNDGLRRGSANLYLVEDSYYVKCSRTGLERAGNSLKFSKNSPDRLVFEVVSAVFEGVLRRNSIDISNGIDREEFFNSDGGLTVCTPKEFVLAKECDTEELESYYDELSNLLYRTIKQYQSATTVEDIEGVVEDYRERSKWLYRD